MPPEPIAIRVAFTRLALIHNALAALGYSYHQRSIGPRYGARQDVEKLLHQAVAETDPHGFYIAVSDREDAADYLRVILHPRPAEMRLIRNGISWISGRWVIELHLIRGFYELSFINRTADHSLDDSAQAGQEVDWAALLKPDGLGRLLLALSVPELGQASIKLGDRHFVTAPAADLLAAYLLSTTGNAGYNYVWDSIEERAYSPAERSD